jgi:hypothetical protein
VARDDPCKDYYDEEEDEDSEAIELDAVYGATIERLAGGKSGTNSGRLRGTGRGIELGGGDEDDRDDKDEDEDEDEDDEDDEDEDDEDDEDDDQDDDDDDDDEGNNHRARHASRLKSGASRLKSGASRASAL